MKLVTIQTIAEFLNCEFIGEGQKRIIGFCSCSNPKLDHLTFMTSGYDVVGDVGGVILDSEMLQRRPRDFKTYLVVDNPKLAFARVMREFYEVPEILTLTGTEITEYGPMGTHGKYTDAKNVSFHGEVFIDTSAEIQPFCSIGTKGFGHIRSEKGELEDFPQIGGVRIEENVEIAAGCNVHRGTLDDTVIREGTKISTHCNIGHNCQIGKHVFIGGNTNLGGSTKVGDYSFIGMRVTTKPGIKIGKNCFIAMGSVVTQDVPDDMKAIGHPAKICGNIYYQQ